MKPIYKKITVVVEHCPVCNKKLTGNGSVTFPWQCDCGKWEAVPKYPWDGEFQIIKEYLANKDYYGTKHN